MIDLLPISVIIPTENRATVFSKMMISLSAQMHQPQEIIIVDASEDTETLTICNNKPSNLKSIVRYIKAEKRGSAVQRSQGLKVAMYDVIGFMDDDIYFEPDCLFYLWQTLQKSNKAGGVNALVTNQQYIPPGVVSSFFYRIMNGKKEDCYAGRVFGPAINLLPDSKRDTDDKVQVDWLNTTCTLYRREALPMPLFDAHFTGYSFMEDLALSLKVGAKWQLFTVRKSRIYHDSQMGAEKSNLRTMAEMELVNRYYVITKIMGKRGFGINAKLFLQQIFGAITSGNIIKPAYLRGKWSAAKKIIFSAK